MKKEFLKDIEYWHVNFILPLHELFKSHSSKLTEKWTWELSKAQTTYKEIHTKNKMVADAFELYVKTLELHPTNLQDNIISIQELISKKYLIKHDTRSQTHWQLKTKYFPCGRCYHRTAEE